jgi:hypothetical protein
MNNEYQSQSIPPPPQGPRTADSQSPVRAALCALIPGIGAVYNREYIKAVVHFTIFASLAYIADSVSVFGLAAFAFYVFTIIDAYRSAEVILRRGVRPQEIDAQQIDLPLWGGILVFLGILFLLDSLDAIRLRTAAQFWPLIPIALGGYLILIYLRGNGQKSRSGQLSQTDSEEERS